ncbi:MAG TPA: hypothetical protein PK280_13795 [Planctomycetota bacterium]|nr:hypothetical protein [Planctomycetota bacterium]
MIGKPLVSLCLGALLAATCLPAPAGEKAPAPGASDAVVLDMERGSFRAFLAWRTPLLVTADGKPRPLPEPKKKGVDDAARKELPVRASSRPAADWASPDFDDSRWPRLHGQAVIRQALGVGDIYAPGNPAEWNLICLRGKFRVSDPAQVKDLNLALTYNGGVVIYVNGKELHRGHMPAGELKADTSAERYGEESYVRPDGKLYSAGDGITDSKDFADRIKTRDRIVPPKDAPAGVVVPGSMLRKGVNVIAIENRSALISDLAIERSPSGQSWQGVLSPWPHAGVLQARLTSASGAGLVPNAGPAAGVEVASAQPLETLATWDYSHPAEKPAPIRMVGVRNGTFSGKLALSSAAAIKGLKASVSELAQDGGKAKLPAAAVKVRFGEPGKPNVGWNGPERFDRLLAESPAEVPPVQVRLRNQWGDTKWQPAPTAVAAVWVTVQVPADAAPGEYKGALTVEAEGLAAKLSVPVELKVHDWKAPEVKDYAQRYNLYQSPDTLAQYYKVPLWSDKHWELMGKSFEVLRSAGNSVCVLNLVVKVPSLNNTESMIRWVKKADGGYDYDFSIAEKYMDLYEKVSGKPAILELFVWEHHTKTDKKPPVPLSVTVVDPATGKTDLLQQPPYDTPENEAFWKPVLTELRKRIEKRGWFDVTAMCYTSYCWGPTKEQVDIFKNIWPDGKWMNCTHSNPASYGGTQGTMPVTYSEWVWGCGGLYNPDGGKGAANYPRPWLKGTARIEVANPRYGVGMFHGFYDSSPLVLYRAAPEAALQGGVRGFGRVGGDFWPLPIGKDGRMGHICDSYAAVGPANNIKALISPGADGATFNERLEMFREGLVVTEAMVFLQKALEAKSAGDLTGKIEELLDERARYYLRTRPNQECSWLSFECSDWQGRDDRLFALCAELAKAGGGK